MPTRRGLTSHVRSFRAILARVHNPHLLKSQMARVINAADTNRLDADSLAAGFEAIAVGYNLRYPNDFENVQRQFEVYDSLYAWCLLDVARNEV